MKKVYRWCLIGLAFMSLMLGGGKTEVHASEIAENVNVTIPTSVSIVFAEDGTNEISNFVIENATANDLTIHSITIEEFNDWRVAQNKNVIPVNTKEIVFWVEGQNLSAGKNLVNIFVPENSEKSIDMKIHRGAWTHNFIPEKALCLEIQYEFELKGDAYALYFEEDTSLRFVRSMDEIKVGDVHNGMTIDGVYTGFEDTIFQSVDAVPWYDGNKYSNRIVTRIVVEDEIRPIGTAYWFTYMFDCALVDVKKLNTSKVTDMTYMFGSVGYKANTFSIEGVNDFDVSNVIETKYMFSHMAKNVREFSMDLSEWNVSKVNNMYYMFAGIASRATTFQLGDLSKWDVSNAVNLANMFNQAGYSADWYLDCSNWNVSKVTYYTRFNYEVDLKVKAPEWVK